MGETTPIGAGLRIFFIYWRTVMKNYIRNVLLVVFGLAEVTRSEQEAAQPVVNVDKPVKYDNPYDALIADLCSQVDNHPAIVVKQLSMLPDGWLLLCSATNRVELMRLLVRAKWLLEINFPATESAQAVYIDKVNDIPGMINRILPLAENDLKAYQSLFDIKSAAQKPLTDNVTQLSSHA